jgi:hypothetical protein
LTTVQTVTIRATMARMTEPIDRFLRALLRDANPEDALAALQETITSVLGTLPPSRQRQTPHSQFIRGE